LAQGRAFPYGIYDENCNAGYVVIGTTHQTAAFAVRAIRSSVAEGWTAPLFGDVVAGHRSR